MQNYVIYQLIDPNTNHIRWIGYSKQVHRRFKFHKGGFNPSTKEWCLSVEPILNIVAGNLSKDDAMKMEFEIIKELKSQENHLLNKYVGSKLSDDVKANVKKIHTGSHKPKTTEHREKIRSALAGKKQSPELIEKRISKLRGKVRGPNKIKKA